MSISAGMVADRTSAKERCQDTRAGAFRASRIAWERGDQWVVARVSEVSAGGLFINTGEPVPIGAMVRLMLEAPGREMRVNAVVRRSVCREGMEIEFLGLDNRERTRLENLLNAIASSAAAAEGSHPAAASATGARPVPVPARQRSVSPPAPRAASETASTRKGNHSLNRGFREQRARRRLNVYGAVELTDPASGSRIHAELTNLGSTGCFVETDAPVSIGLPLILSITKDKEHFQAQARAVHAMPGRGAGLLFTSVEPEHLGTLERWLQSAGEAVWFEENRRRGQRVSLSIPIHVRGRDAAGNEFEETARTAGISRSGGTILLTVPVEKGQRLVLFNPASRVQMECIVVHVGKPSQKREVGVAFTLPDGKFWGVSFPDFSCRETEKTR